MGQGASEIMYFDSFQDFIHMGGHGLYVWLAYGVSLAVFVLLVALPVIKKKRMLKAIKMRSLHDQQGVESVESTESDGNTA